MLNPCCPAASCCNPWRLALPLMAAAKLKPGATGQWPLRG